MNIRRLGVLLWKEFKYGSKSYFLIFAIIAPLTYTIFINLFFGSFFDGRPKLGMIDHGESRIAVSLKNMKSIDLKEYTSEMELKNAVETGARDAGIVLQENFDFKIKNGESTKITAYIWGESLLKNRTFLASAFLHQVRAFSGKKAPVDIIPVPLGNEKNIPWKERLLPTVVLMAIFISGFAVPATSLVDEKEKYTIGAILTSPATQTEIFISKGLMGIIVSITMGIVILILNHAFNAQLALLILILLLGAIMACCIGLIFGSFMNTMAAAYSAIKGLGIVLYAPGIIAVFPQIPKWIGMFFPTFYVINPIMEITRRGGNWSSVNHDILILILEITVFFTVVGVLATKTKQQEA